MDLKGRMATDEMYGVFEGQSISVSRPQIPQPRNEAALILVTFFYIAVPIASQASKSGNRCRTFLWGPIIGGLTGETRERWGP